ncbi:GNAT domain-containing protein [Globomyces pollinis-pini]|nr:GNAT domain-containing protein [Globomyces pollinis-pini]
MQQSWLNDDQKCTFILLSPDTTKRVPPFEIYGGMVGDINLYFNDHDSSSTAEIEIMIAEKEARGKGIGQEALAIMIDYSITQLHVEYLISKIGFKNQSSLNLFSKFGFVETSRSEIFQEVTLQLQVDSNRPKPIYETIQIN